MSEITYRVRATLYRPDGTSLPAALPLKGGHEAAEAMSRHTLTGKRGEEFNRMDVMERIDDTDQWRTLYHRFTTATEWYVIYDPNLHVGHTGHRSSDREVRFEVSPQKLVTFRTDDEVPHDTISDVQHWINEL